VVATIIRKYKILKTIVAGLQMSKLPNLEGLAIFRTMSRLEEAHHPSASPMSLIQGQGRPQGDAAQ
jgi:hypothetical protein